MNIKAFVITHKKYWMPNESVYFPLHVGREGKEELGYIGDNIGENISLKNGNYCELTGFYWIWKNYTCDYIGICHYRRYFGLPKAFLVNSTDAAKKVIADERYYKKILNKYDVIVPQALTLDDKTVLEDYSEHHNVKDLLLTKQIIEEMYPEYSESLEKILKGNKLYYCNMLFMSKENFDCYCEWLFGILFDLEKKVDLSDYDAYNRRIFGFLSERLFNVWVLHNNLKVYEVPMVELERNTWRHVENRYKDYLKYKLYEWKNL